MIDSLWLPRQSRYYVPRDRFPTDLSRFWEELSMVNKTLADYRIWRQRCIVENQMFRYDTPRGIQTKLGFHKSTLQWIANFRNSRRTNISSSHAKIFWILKTSINFQKIGRLYTTFVTPASARLQTYWNGLYTVWWVADSSLFARELKTSHFIGYQWSRYEGS